MNFNNYSINKTKENRGVRNCVINLPKKFLTPTQGALLFNAALENVLLFSGQISLAFPLFKQHVKQIIEKKQENQPRNIKSWSSQMHSRQLEAANKTIDQVLAIEENVIQEFKKTEVTEAVIGFGSTVFSLKHAIVIRLPPVDANHFCANHERENLGLCMKFSQLLAISDEMSMNISDEKSFKVFVLLKKPVQADIQRHDDFFRPMPAFQLPKRCKTIYLQVFLDESGKNDEIYCCKLMKICSDVSNMSIKDEGEEANEMKDTLFNWFISSVPVTGPKKGF